MMKFNKVLAFALATTMVFGGSLTAFAGAGDPQSADGTGTYEGNKMAYPTFTLTLPTVPTGSYNYIADPNGNIKATEGARAEGYTFEGDTGIYFLTDSTGKKYTSTSYDYEVTNENAQDVQVTAQLKIKTAGSAGLKVSKTADFSDEDVKTSTAIYLAIQNAGKTKIEPLKAAAADSTAEVSMIVKGRKDNYVPDYDASKTPKYFYSVKEDDDLKWGSCKFNLTGALNMGVAWTDASITFPLVTVTYKIAQVPIMEGGLASGYSYTWASDAPTGTVQALSIDGVDRPGIITAGNVTYATNKLTLKSGPVDTFGLDKGNHTIVVKIGSNADTAVEYTLNIEN